MLLTYDLSSYPLTSKPKGPSINYVSKILPIFDPLSPLRKQLYYISLYSSIRIWLTLLPLACLRSFWMAPNACLCVAYDSLVIQLRGAINKPRG